MEWGLVLAGILLGQIILYGPSLAGWKILLPLDILAQPKVYLPRTAEIARIEPQNAYLSDLVYQFEPARRFAASEWRAGRVPMWAPYQFNGVPVIWPKFSPFLLLECCTPSPVVLAWGQLVAAVVAGLGAYCFFRRALGIGFWPATICAWCYPVTGFFVLWLGFPTSLSVYWLPWLLQTVEETVRGAKPWAPLLLAVATGLTLISGHADVAAQVLLASLVYAAGRWAHLHARGWRKRQARHAGAGVAAGWALGILLAAPFLLPLREYMQSGARLARRTAGQEERPPVGWEALPQVVLPDMYGTMATGSLRLAAENQSESSAAAYAGVLATLVAAPLAFCRRSHRAFTICFLLLLIVSLSWCLNLPGLVALLRLPGLNVMSHNRLTLIGPFAILGLAAIGLDTLAQGTFRWRRWMYFPMVLLASLCAWCVYRSGHVPEPIATQLAGAVSRGNAVRWVQNLDDVNRAQSWFTKSYATAAVWCGIGVLGWALLRRSQGIRPRFLPVVGLLLFGDLLRFGQPKTVQADPALYYPSLPVFEKLAQAGGRIIGDGCLPPNLATMFGLQDVRGYDGVDPARQVELLLAAAKPALSQARYAATLYLAPNLAITTNGEARLSPLLDMLGVRNVLLRGRAPPEARPVVEGLDYWVLKNPGALERVFVPKHVEVETNDAVRLQKLSATDFAAGEVSYVELPLSLPGLVSGTARLLEETPSRIKTALAMETAGLVILTDRWDPGWRAYLGGKQVPVLRANHTLRGVVAPPGEHLLEFCYQPTSFRVGLMLAAAAGAILLAWLGLIVWRRAVGASSQER
jgi:hypothetical protein